MPAHKMTYTQLLISYTWNELILGRSSVGIPTVEALEMNSFQAYYIISGPSRFLSTTKVGDNTFGSVRPSVCLWALSCLLVNLLAFDLWGENWQNFGKRPCLKPLFHTLLPWLRRGQMHSNFFVPRLNKVEEGGYLNYPPSVCLPQVFHSKSL